jgi:hypothetical protein
MNVAALKTIVRRYGFDDSDPLLTWLNEGMRIVEDERRWTFREKTASVVMPALGSLERASIASDLAKIRWVRSYPTGFEDVKLSFREPMWLETEFGETETDVSGGTYWTWTNDSLFVFATPEVDLPLKVRYVSLKPELTSDSDVPGLPQPFHYCIALAAAMIALMAENEEDRAGTAQQQLASRLDTLAANWAEREADMPTGVSDVMGYFD